MAKKLPMFTFEQEQSPWHKGTPTETGMYIVLINGNYLFWEVDNLATWNFEPVTAWQKIEPYKED